ncbi:MAG: mechanosensitive ion channel family protein [Oscillospiraceae bacterium]|nr:mechanosensitive ion channel family protein [Oscillospiraceae bacterium]
MKHPKRKLIGGILLLLVLTGLFGGFLLISNAGGTITHRMETRASMIKAVNESLENDLQLSLNVGASIMEKNRERLFLSAAACRKVLEADWDGNPMAFLDGAVITATRNGIRCPDGFPADLIIDADALTEKTGIFYTLSPGAESDSDLLYAVYYYRLDEGVWFVEWEKYENLDQRMNELYDFRRSFTGIEKAFNTELVLILAAPDENGGHPLFYKSDSLPEAATAEDLGITGEMLAKSFSASEELTPEALADVYQTIIIDGQPYEVFFRQLDGSVISDVTVAYLTPFEDTKEEITEQMAILLVVFFAIGIVFMVWLFSVLMLVRRHTLNERQRKDYSFGTCWRRIFGILGAAAAIILAVSALMLSLSRLFSVYRQVDTSLLALYQRIEENADQPRVTEAVNKETYEGFAALTAELFTEYPDLFTADDLQTFCDIIEADYIMLFDSRGDEILTNSRYVGLHLGKDPSSATYDFRLLLNGVPMITHDLMTDEQTNLTNFMIGACVGDPEKGGHYGALLMAVPKDRIVGREAELEENIMASLVSDGMLVFSVDRESGVILNASDRKLIGNSAVDLGLPEAALRNGFQDSFKLNGLSFYGKNEELNGILYFSAAESSHIYGNVLTLSLLSALVSFFLLLIFALYMMYGYRKEFEEYASVGALLEDPVNEVRLSAGGRKRSMDPSARWKPEKPENDVYLPRRNASLAARILLILCVAWIGFRLLSGGTNASLFSFIIRGQWTKGFNLFAFTGIFILLAEVAVAVTLLRFFIQILSNAFGTRGETVCRLLLNLLSYGGIIVFVYFALYDLGFSPGTLLASLGLLSFAVSLGAKDLVTDILAGLSIVFDGEYQVGDIIEVGGYRGEVLEIGVRTTKLEGRGGNIKIIGNRDVKNVVNMTRKNSWYPLDISISADQSLENIEKMLREQLPHIGEAIPEIISGPYYKGVIAIGKGSITLSIIAECSEADYHVVQRALNRSIQELYAEKGIKIL